MYLKFEVHEGLHDGDELKNTLKRIGQYYYEKTHSRIEFMAHTHKNYLTYPLTDEEKRKYAVDPEVLDLNSLVDVDVLFKKNIKKKSFNA